MHWHNPTSVTRTRPLVTVTKFYVSFPPKILDPVLAWGRGLAANPLGWVEPSDEDQGQERRDAGTSRAGAGEEDGEGDGGERGKGEG